MKKSIITFILIVLISFPTGVYAETVQPAEPTTEDFERMFSEILRYVDETYVHGDEVTEQQLFEAAIKGMFSQLDIYSEFMTAAEGQEFINSINSTYVGIGVQVNKIGDYVVITRVFKDSPASKAGIQKGDFFISINGNEVKGLSTQQILTYILGEEGTSIEMILGRGGATYQVSPIRSKIQAPTVESVPITELYNGLNTEEAQAIEYINVSSFAEKTDIEFNEAIEAAKAKGAKYLILDLRDNGGGYTNAAINVARTIVPKGPIVYFVDVEGKERVFSSTIEETPFEVVALVNEYSASATEFVAGAIKDSKVGQLVGETTFGKGVAQFMFEYDFGYYIKLTVEEFFTRDRNKINQVGVSPNFLVEIPDYIIGTTKYFVHDTSDGVYEFEKVLDYLGYEVGTPDRDFGQNTFAAINKFQLDQGLYGYGVCDLTTQSKINEALYKSIEESDPQLNKAVSLILEKMNK